MNNSDNERNMFKKHYDSEARDYDKNRDLRNSLTIFNKQSQIKWIKEKIGDRKKKVLECGSGTGKFLIPLTQDNFNVSAIDYSPEMIKVSKEKALEVGLKLNISKASIEKLPHPEQTFDAVYSIAVIRHFEDCEPAILEMKRVLCKDGELIVDFLNQNYFRPYQLILKLLGLNSNVKNKRFFTNYYYSPKDFSNILKKNGFEILSTKYFVQIPPRRGLGWLIPIVSLINTFTNFGAVGFILARKL